jgi:DUF971 family protein
MSHVAPIEIRNLVQSRLLEIQWSDLSKTIVSHRNLREHCRCTPCRIYAMAHGAPVMVEESITLRDIVPVGRDGVQLFFTDGHSRGIYPWEFLRGMEDSDYLRMRRSSQAFTGRAASSV